MELSYGSLDRLASQFRSGLDSSGSNTNPPLITRQIVCVFLMSSIRISVEQHDVGELADFQCAGTLHGDPVTKPGAHTVG
jgi:hypothetical protein